MELAKEIFIWIYPLALLWTGFDLGRNWDHNIKAIKIHLRARRAYKTGATA